MTCRVRRARFRHRAPDPAPLPYRRHREGRHPPARSSTVVRAGARRPGFRPPTPPGEPRDPRGPAPEPVKPCDLGFLRLDRTPRTGWEGRGPTGPGFQSRQPTDGGPASKTFRHQGGNDVVRSNDHVDHVESMTLVEIQLMPSAGSADPDCRFLSAALPIGRRRHLCRIGPLVASGHARKTPKHEGPRPQEDACPEMAIRRPAILVR
jgi:hypothetical protein